MTDTTDEIEALKERLARFERFHGYAYQHWRKRISDEEYGAAWRDWDPYNGSAYEHSPIPTVRPNDPGELSQLNKEAREQVYSWLMVRGSVYLTASYRPEAMQWPRYQQQWFTSGMTLLAAAGGIREDETSLPPPLVLDMSNSTSEEIDALCTFWKTIENPAGAQNG